MGIPYQINETRTQTRRIDGRSKDVRLWTSSSRESIGSSFLLNITGLFADFAYDIVATASI